MSGPAEENGGKSSKMPTLSTPALVMSSSPSAAAGRAARARPSASARAGAKARRLNNDFFMGPPREGEAQERAAGTSFAGNAGVDNRRPEAGRCPSNGDRLHDRSSCFVPRQARDEEAQHEGKAFVASSSK